MTDQGSASRSKGHMFETCLVSASVKSMYLWYDMFRRNLDITLNFFLKTNNFNVFKLKKLILTYKVELQDCLSDDKKYCGKIY